MSHLVFMMGEFEASFPCDRQYAKNHMWALQQGGHWRFGFTAYAVRLLQDVYFLEWLVEEEAELAAGEEIGAIESKKAESALYAPAGGQLKRFNAGLMSDPSTINVDKYGAGWLFEMDCGAPRLLSTEQYVEHLASVWEVTQRTIKGQLQD